MKDQLSDIFWHVIAPAFYLAIAIYLVMKVWNRNKLGEEENDVS